MTKKKQATATAEVGDVVLVTIDGRESPAIVTRGTTDDGAVIFVTVFPRSTMPFPVHEPVAHVEVEGARLTWRRKP